MQTMQMLRSLFISGIAFGLGCAASLVQAQTPVTIAAVNNDDMIRMSGSGRFDVVTIGTYEAPTWADRGWLVPPHDMPEGCDVEDILPTIRAGLSIGGTL